MDATVSERLVAFVRQVQSSGGVPPEVRHEAKRLLLNQLKASVGATTHPAVQILHGWCDGHAASGAPAHVLWFGTQASPGHAALVNGALFEVLDFHDTYIPTYMHAVSAVLPAVLALAEAGGYDGKHFLDALALGIEIELAVAVILMPTGYYRGFVPAGLAGGVGAAAACSVLAGLDDMRMRNALGIAMCTAFGTYESVGSMTLSYITGATAKAGWTACELARRGFDAPRTAFEGEKGMLASYSNENSLKIDAVLPQLGRPWRIFGQTYKTIPTETITHGPVECVLALRPRAAGRRVLRMVFGVEAIVVKIVTERMQRFGRPSSDLTARFDLCHCAAAAWERGKFGLDEMREAAYTDASILDLRSRIELRADPARKTFEGCSLRVEFTDGSSDAVTIDNFLGTPARPIGDAELGGLFRLAAAPMLSHDRAGQVVKDVWGLDESPDCSSLMSHATFDVRPRTPASP